ncbi:MAG TPA: PQQ-binding-like beta-propeller repeat protein [Kofleriaceae bacterium]|jgi:outer membrane protein assembly factor BamB
MLRCVLVLGLIGCGHVDFDDAGATARPCNDTGLQAGAPWPMQGGCADHGGRSTHVGPHSLPVKWMVELEAIQGTCSPPVIGNDGTIYVGSENNGAGIQAITPTGTVVWAADVANMSAAAALGGSVLYGGTGGTLSAIDLRSSAVLWQAPGDVIEVDSSPTIGPDGSIYFGAEDATIRAYDSNGFQEWAFTAAADVDASPAIGADGTIIAGTILATPGSAALYALDPVTGSMVWSQQFDGAVSTAAIGADGSIYVGSDDGHLYQLARDGTPGWTFAGGAGVYAPAIGADGTIYVGSADDALYALDPAAGTPRWKYVTGGPIEATPTIGLDGTIYIISSDGFLYALSPAGKLIDHAQLGQTCSSFASSAIGADGTLFATGNVVNGTDSIGYLYAFGP